MRGLVVTLWWMALYPFSALIGAVTGYLVYLVIVIVPAAFGTPKLGLLSAFGVLAGLAVAGGTFVRTAGRLAPALPTGVAAAACGVAIAGSIVWVHRLQLTAAAAIVTPLAFGALAGVLATHEREQQARLRAASADQCAPESAQ